MSTAVPCRDDLLMHIRAFQVMATHGVAAVEEKREASLVGEHKLGAAHPSEGGAAACASCRVSEDDERKDGGATEVKFAGAPMALDKGNAQEQKSPSIVSPDQKQQQTAVDTSLRDKPPQLAA